MFSTRWKIYTSTEEDCIEHFRCTEALTAEGLSIDVVENAALRCETCILSGRCSVIRSNPFEGARTA